MLFLGLANVFLFFIFDQDLIFNNFFFPKWKRKASPGNRQCFSSVSSARTLKVELSIFIFSCKSRPSEDSFDLIPEAKDGVHH